MAKELCLPNYFTIDGEEQIQAFTKDISVVVLKGQK